MKYVMIEYMGGKFPILFPDYIPHDYFRGMHPVSAGMVTLYGAQEPLEHACCSENGIDVRVGGKSVSLGLAYHPDDETIIAAEVLRHYN